MRETDGAATTAAGDGKVIDMGFMDKVKGLTKGRSKQINEGIDKAADLAQDKLPDSVDPHVDTAAAKAKEVVDKLDDA